MRTLLLRKVVFDRTGPLYQTFVPGGSAAISDPEIRHRLGISPSNMLQSLTRWIGMGFDAAKTAGASAPSAATAQASTTTIRIARMGGPHSIVAMSLRKTWLEARAYNTISGCLSIQAAGSAAARHPRGGSRPERLKTERVAAAQRVGDDHGLAVGRDLAPGSVL